MEEDGERQVCTSSQKWRKKVEVGGGFTYILSIMVLEPVMGTHSVSQDAHNMKEEQPLLAESHF